MGFQLTGRNSMFLVIHLGVVICTKPVLLQYLEGNPVSLEKLDGALTAACILLLSIPSFTPQSAQTSPSHCPHGGCLGRLQISFLLTQQMSWLQTQQMSCLQTQHMSCLQTILVSCGRIRKTVEGSEKLQPKSWQLEPKSWDLGKRKMESFHGRLDFIMKHLRFCRDSKW